MKVRLFALVILLSLATPAYSAPRKPLLDNQIILSEGGLVMVTVNNVISNSCNGTAGLYSPENIELFPDYNNQRGQSATIGPFDAGTELIFYISPWSFCSGYTYLSTNPNHAHVIPLAAPNSWRIDWEDLPDSWPPDNDFNDLILVVRLVQSVPDFKQDNPDWESAPYDNIFQYWGSTIGGVGCSVTSSADLLNYYGAYDIDPQTLDDCMSTDLVKGYVRWEEDPDCAEGNYDSCSAGAIRWDKVGACSNPSDPNQQPHLMRFVQALQVGGWIKDPDTQNPVQVTKEMLKALADEDLADGWPPIFQVKTALSPSGVHFVVATAKTDPTYAINDPVCGTWPDCPLSKHTLEEYGDNLTGIVRFTPTDGVFRPSLIVNGFSPIEFYVTDPQGRRTGFSANSGTPYTEIPGAGYYFQPPVIDFSTGQTLGDGMVEFYILDVLPGEYRVTVTGTGEGDYGLLAEHHAEPLVTYTAQETGSVYPGQTVVYDLQISAGSPPQWEEVPPLRVYLPLISRNQQ